MAMQHFSLGGNYSERVAVERTFSWREGCIAVRPGGAQRPQRRCRIIGRLGTQRPRQLGFQLRRGPPALACHGPRQPHALRGLGGVLGGALFGALLAARRAAVGAGLAGQLPALRAPTLPDHGGLRCGADKSSGLGLHAEFAAQQRATCAKPGGIQQDDHADTAHSAVCPRWGLSGRPGGAALESRLLRAAWAPTRVLCPEAHAHRPRRAPGRHARCLPAPRLLRAAGLQLQGLLRGHQHRGHFQRRRRARMLRLLFGGVSGRRSCAADAGVSAPLPRGLRAAVLADA
mmetsp:Transcript_22958/g.64508  ORF Transcript_22958/g.64508 Transcript_22958/m.64508 type:complete len:288 (-) Transcript_22958:449-1312(-)